MADELTNYIQLKQQSKMSQEDAFEIVKMQTHVLKVHIHCQGCQHKVKKLLRKIPGVYEVKIEAAKDRVTISGDVDGPTLVKKLVKSGKHAELLTPRNWEKDRSYLNSLMGGLNLGESQPQQTNSDDEDPDHWIMRNYLNNNHIKKPQIDDGLWNEEFTNDESSMDHRQNTAMNNHIPAGYGALEEFNRQRIIHAELPAYAYQNQYPTTSNAGSWYNHPYPWMYTSTHIMHPTGSTENNYMHHPLQEVYPFQLPPPIFGQYWNQTASII